MATVPYATPPIEYDRPRSQFARACLQVAHRAVSIALILLVIGIAAIAAGKTAAPLLLWAFGAGDLALLGAFLSLASDRRRSMPGKESFVTSWLAAGVAVVALLLFFIFRLRGA